MEFLQFYIGEAVTACLLQVLVFRRWHRRAEFSALVGALGSGALWFPAYAWVKHAEWGWKTGLLDFSFMSVMLPIFAYVIFSCYVLPAVAISAWACAKLNKRFSWLRGLPE